MRESPEGDPEELSMGLGGRRVGGGVGEGVPEKVFIGLVASTLTQRSSGRVCQEDKHRKGVPGRRNRGARTWADVSLSNWALEGTSRKDVLA